MRILSDPIFGDIDAHVPQNTTHMKPLNKFNLQSKTRGSFATRVTSTDSSDVQIPTRKQERLNYHCYSNALSMEKCQKLKEAQRKEGLPIGERNLFICLFY